jgi:hypothetical protein
VNSKGQNTILGIAGRVIGKVPGTQTAILLNEINISYLLGRIGRGI